jgi:protocatechuate 3,4-dioxygenase beta subunit
MKVAPQFPDMNRRKMLRLFGAAAATAIVGCGRDRSAPSDALVATPSLAAASGAAMPACVVRPEQTEGPYFVDEKLHRSDIRVEPTDKSLKPGAPLRLEFQVSRIAGGSCVPLAGAIVDVWHCDALGVYSDVRDRSFDTRGKKFLRGYQIADAKGMAQFLTIYPGWYEGRAVHIHFKIRTEDAARRGLEFTSQLYFDESITDQIYNSVPYNSKGRRTTTNDSDFIFRRGGKQLIPMLTKDAQGYTAKFDIGLQIG